MASPTGMLMLLAAGTVALSLQHALRRPPYGCAVAAATPALVLGELRSKIAITRFQQPVRTDVHVGHHGAGCPAEAAEDVVGNTARCRRDYARPDATSRMGGRSPALPQSATFRHAVPARRSEYRRTRQRPSPTWLLTTGTCAKPSGGSRPSDPPDPGAGRAPAAGAVMSCDDPVTTSSPDQILVCHVPAAPHYTARELVPADALRSRATHRYRTSRDPSATAEGLARFATTATSLLRTAA